MSLWSTYLRVVDSPDSTSHGNPIGKLHAVRYPSAPVTVCGQQVGFGLDGRILSHWFVRWTGTHPDRCDKCAHYEAEISHERS